jgi:asparagine synthase (glutamine-hydrolysing)
MCGIAGIYNTDRRPVDNRLLKRMGDVLRHRGPDDEGNYTDGNLGFAFRRLSIIDLAGGHQPMLNEDGSCAIVFNGEIYNYLELKTYLISKGHVFKTNSDTEVILHLYDERGDDCVHDLRGMFAFAIWDRKKQRLFLARDRLGVKPLYYYAEGGTFIFASELKAIIQDPAVKKELDLEALSDYLSFIYVPAPKTIFKNIRKQQPGHCLIVTAAGVVEKSYWDVNFECPAVRSEEHLVEELYSLLTEAVRLRLVSEVPLGAFLSGGIDSSAVVAIMSEVLEDAVITSSIGFQEEEYNELQYARQMAEKFGTRHHEYMVEPKALEVLEKLVWHYDEPFADSSAIPTYYVSKMARENVTVALTGDGGDENFAGYRRYLYDSLENGLRTKIPRPFRRHVLGSIARLYPKADWAPRVFRGKTLLTNLSLEPERAYFNSVISFKNEQKEQLLRGDVINQLNSYDSFSVFERHLGRAGGLDPLSKVQYLDMKTYLADDILTKVDRASMAVSLEAREPLLDHKLVEFVATIPPSLKLRGKTGKYILKQAMRKLLPPSIINRHKMGFAVPLDVWFRREIKEFTSDLLFGPASANSGYFNVDFVAKIWKQHQVGLRDNSAKLWILLMFELWYRKFVSNQ